MSISSPFIHRPVATSLLIAAILLVGIAAYPLLPVAPLPRVEFPTIQVTANLPGASPETMASTVAQPLERQFSQISGVAQMPSVSVGGSTQVVVQFDLDRNIDGAALDVQAAINNAGGQLPRNLPNPPIFRKVNPADSPILILAVQSDVLPLIEVDDHADNILSQQISQISGVSQVSTPVTLRGTFQGTAQAFQASLSTQPYLIAAALIAVYIILGILYESFILPITILSTLPSAGVGALLMLMAAGYDLSVIALIGVILLIGIVKKNGIMMVDFAISAERQRGATPRDAIREACLMRFRPILMTTMAALLGGLPLMLGTGAGSELRKPLGYAMVGGLILSQLLTLYTTPVVYLYLDRLQRWLTPARRTTMPALASKIGATAD